VSGRASNDTGIKIIGVSPEALVVTGETDGFLVQVAVDSKEPVVARVGDKLHSVSVKTTFDPAFDVFNFKGTSSPLDLSC
jgi:hypothetical protein